MLKRIFLPLVILFPSKLVLERERERYVAYVLRKRSSPIMEDYSTTLRSNSAIESNYRPASN